MAILLKTLILLDKRKFDEAITELRDALVIHPSNYDLYQALVQAFLLQNKTQEVCFFMENALVSFVICREEFYKISIINVTMVARASL